MQNRTVIIKNAESKSRIITLLSVIFIKDFGAWQFYVRS